MCHPSIPPELSFESGRKFSGTWADLLVIEFEHYGLNPIGLSSFMQGIRDATPSVDSMVTVMATLPMSGLENFALFGGPEATGNKLIA